MAIFLSHRQDDSHLRDEDKRKRRISQSDKPRFPHTSSFTGRGTSGKDTERMGSRPSKFSRRQNEYQHFDSRYSDHRYRPRDYSAQTRDYTTRRFSARERRDNNYRDNGNDYNNYDEYDYYDYSYHGNNSYASHEYDYRSVRSRDGSHRRDHVIRNKPYSSRDRTKPYSRQTTR